MNMMSIFPLQADPLSPVGSPTSTTGSPVLDTALDVDTSVAEEVVASEVEAPLELASLPLEVEPFATVVGSSPPESEVASPLRGPQLATHRSAA
jgi:hypothetical protein